MRTSALLKLHFSALTMVSAVSTALATDVQPPQARLSYTGQSGPKSEYTVTGFPGCADSGHEIICILSDSTQSVVATVNEDGSFALKVPYESGHKGISIKASDMQGNVSPAMHTRLDYPLFFRMGGWVRFTSASMDENLDLRERDEIKVAIQNIVKKREEKAKSWLSSIDKSTISEAFEGGLEPPDSLVAILQSSLPQDSWERALEKTTPEDIKVYGYAPEGDTATCIMGANGLSFSSPIREDRGFTIVIPYEAVEQSRGDLATFIINITDVENRLLVAHGTNPMVPRWAHEQQRAKERASLIGHLAPDFTLRFITEDGSVRLNGLRGHNLLINLWATWCGPCVRELPHIQELFLELDRSKGYLLSINLDRDIKKAQDFLKTEGYTFPVLSDTTGIMWKRYKAFGIPMTIIIDRDGIIRHIEDGYLSKESTLTILADISAN